MIDWLLGLEGLSIGGEGVSVGFARPLPAWLWLAVIALCAGLAWWSYRKIEGARWVRGLLAVSRTLLLILLVVLLAGPRLERAQVIKEKDLVLMLVDRSASMGVLDVTDERGMRITRDEQLRRGLGAGNTLWTADDDREVLWLGFDGGVYELARDETGGVVLGEPEGRRTRIGHAVEAALRKAGARPVAGVFVLSDGRSIDDVDGWAERRLDAAGIGVYTVALGAARGVEDVGVVRVRGPGAVFAGDKVPVEVELERLGGEAGGTSIVELVGEDGQVLASEEVSWAGTGTDQQPVAETQRVRLRAVADADDARKDETRTWRVRVRGPDGREDLVPCNDAGEVSFTTVGRPLRVLYIDGGPRWEQRYLKNVLVREESVECAALLLAPGRVYLQDGELSPVRVPTSAQEWDEWDVVVLGDLWPGVLTEEQMDGLRQRVSVNGGGLVWIGGEGLTPGAWARTPLEDLLPMVLSQGAGDAAGSRGGGLGVWDQDVVMHATEAAERLGVLRLGSAGEGWPDALTDPSMGWSRLRWAQRLERADLKPAVEVLAEAVGVESERSGPLIVSMRYGAGRIVYVGTDETWRWRFGRGEVLNERYWLGLIRLLGRESAVRAAGGVELTISPARVEVGGVVRVGVRVLDQAAAERAPRTVRASVEREAGTDVQRVAEIELVRRDNDAGGVEYTGSWSVQEGGTYRVVVDGSVFGMLSGELVGQIEGWVAEDELRRPQADHAYLADLSARTGGSSVTLAGLGDVELPKRSVEVAGESEIESLWDTPAALLLFLGLLGFEWVVRRVIRLV